MTDDKNEIVLPKASIQELLRDRVQKEFIQLIPQDQWDKLIKREIDFFLKEPEDPYGRSGQRKEPSLFGKMIQEVFNEQIKARLRKEIETEGSELNNYLWGGMPKGDDGQPTGVLPVILRKTIEQIPPKDLWASLLSPFVQDLLYKMNIQR